MWRFWGTFGGDFNELFWGDFNPFIDSFNLIFKYLIFDVKGFLLFIDLAGKYYFFNLNFLYLSRYLNDYSKF